MGCLHGFPTYRRATAAPPQPRSWLTNAVLTTPVRTFTCRTCKIPKDNGNGICPRCNPMPRRKYEPGVCHRLGCKQSIVPGFCYCRKHQDDYEKRRKIYNRMYSARCRKDSDAERRARMQLMSIQQMMDDFD